MINDHAEFAWKDNDRMKGTRPYILTDLTSTLTPFIFTFVGGLALLSHRIRNWSVAQHNLL
jgi:hypothetical protein